MKTVDVGAVIDDGPWTGYQKLLIVGTALTIILDGVDNQLLPNAVPRLITEWGRPRADFINALSIGPFGMMIGGLIGGVLGDRLGRRTALLGSVLAFAVLTLGLAAVLSAFVSLHITVLFNNANWFAAKLMLLVLRFSADLPGGFIYVEMPRLTHPPRCELTVFALNEGGAVHVRAEGRDWLLDCADEAHYNHTVLPYLRSRGVNRLDGLLLTHGNAKQ